MVIETVCSDCVLGIEIHNFLGENGGVGRPKGSW